MPCAWSAASVPSSHYTAQLTVFMAGVSLFGMYVCVQSQTTGSQCPCFCAAATAVSEDGDVSRQLLPNNKPDYLGSRVSGLGYVYVYPRASYLDELSTGPGESWTTARETVGSGGQRRDVVCVCVSVWEVTGQGEDPGPAAGRTVCLSPATRGIHVVCMYIMYIFPSNGPPSRSAREGNFTIHRQKKNRKKNPAMSVLHFEVSLVVYFCLSLLQSLTCFGHSQNLLHIQVISGILSCLFHLQIKGNF